MNRIIVFWSALVAVLGAALAVPAEKGTRLVAAPGADFFEEKIRPVLVEQCYACHSAEAEQAKKLKGGLRLDSREAMRKGGATGPAVVPGSVKDSLLIEALRHGSLRMPPKKKLPDAVIADFVKWIEMGAPDSRDTATARPNPADKARSHWAFQPIRSPEVPAVKRSDWVRTPIDAFVLARLEKAGLPPPPAADRPTLLRRASFDLVGLPPAPDTIEPFLRDDRPEAFAELVERLLASNHYGERWGRHWLDVVRYADSAGYEIDNFYEFAWLYRDYVIRSFNADKPFDRFVQEQLAGDELWPDSIEAKTATGFATVGPYAFEGGIGRPKVVEYQRLTDLADTTSAAFLGLTAGCARCHDHKFDPIAQMDYFGLQAVFAPSKPVKLPLDAQDPKGTAMTVLANQDRAPPTHLLRRGELDLPGEVSPPALFRTLAGGGVLPESPKGRRTALARWLTAPENPLTARVIANRVWQWHFGQGLVQTPNDFGMQGEKPTHPELLDYLAAELVRHDWSIKHLHRLIMRSATYQMAGRASREAAAQDPDCRLLSRFPRRRLEAEAIWDNLHAVAGTINLEPFGPAVYAPVDRDVLSTKLNVKWEADKFLGQWTRRGVYLVVRRSLVYPFFDSFNLTSPVTSCGCRDSTVVAPQALELLNGPVAVKQAQAFAGRLLRECGDDLETIVARAWLTALGRPATPGEQQRTLEYLATAERSLVAAKKPLPTPTGAPDVKVAPARAAALVEFCLALLNANEFIFID